jgi:hypothetical protein
MRQMFFVVLLPDGTVVEPRVEKRLVVQSRVEFWVPRVGVCHSQAHAGLMSLTPIKHCRNELGYECGKIRDGFRSIELDTLDA